MNRFRNIDWDRLYKVLVVQAAVCLRHYRGPDTFDGGHDCEDVCAEVLKEFYGSEDALAWKESKGTLETYLGIEVVLNAQVSSASDAWVELTGKLLVGKNVAQRTQRRRIATKTLIWAAGVRPHPLLATLPCGRNRRGQLITNPYMSVPGYQGLWALGDCGEIPDGNGKLCPPTVQFVLQQGRVIAENIASELGIGTVKPFAYKPIGLLASLGRRCAVAEIWGFDFSGFFAWWLWRTIYLLKLPGLERKVRVALDWTLDLFFPRDIVLLKLLMRPSAADLTANVNIEAETASSIPTF